jgi:hypothetical protein
VTISIVNLANNGGVNITVVESDSMLIADLRGLFFNVSDSIGLGTASSISVAPTNVGSKVVSANNVISVGSGNVMNGNGNPGRYDVGVEIGTPGIPGIVAGGDDIQTATITVAWSQLKISHLCNQRFGVRLTSVGTLVGGRAGSSKLFGTSCAC